VGLRFVPRYKENICSQNEILQIYALNQRVRFNRVYFTILRAKGVEDIDFGVDFNAGNSKKLQKLGLEGKFD
jgi:hypothetical protein